MATMAAFMVVDHKDFLPKKIFNYVKKNSNFTGGPGY